MEKNALVVEKREKRGKCPNRRLRASGKIPAIVYGGKDQLSVTVDRLEFERKFKRISENILISLEIAGEDSREVLIRDYQRDKVRGNLIHLDFYEVVKGRKLRTKVPLKFEGTPVGVRVDKGLFDVQLYQVNIECEPKDIPESIEVDVSGLEVNQNLFIRDLTFPEGVTSLDPEDLVVALVLSAIRIDLVEEADADEGEEVEEAEETEESASEE